jgi:hypothetical protein
MKTATHSNIRLSGARMGSGTGALRNGIRSTVVDYAPFKTIEVDAFPRVVV